MNEPISWPELFRHVDQDGDTVKRLSELQKNIEDLTTELEKKQSLLTGLASATQTRLRGAIEVAKLLGVEVPPEAHELLASLCPTEVQRPSGGYIWKPKGRVMFRAGMSQAMWRLSQGSGGSAGRQGVLTAGEFRKMLGKKNLAKLADGQEITLNLPNGQEVAVSRAGHLEARGV